MMGDLYVGQVMHRRLRPRVHQLTYRLFAMLLDLDRIDELAGTLRLFSRNRFNLLSFRDADYGDGSGTPLRQQVEVHLARIGIHRAGRIRLLTMPRLFGFAFNPLSLFYCEDRAGRLVAILYEVHNTFGERHVYVLPIDADGDALRQQADKAFHVSPFLPMGLDYRFRASRPDDRLKLGITVSDREGPLLIAVQSLRRRALSDRAILRVVAAMPLMTFKVVAGILWEAARLWLKGLSVHRYPGPAADPASYGEIPQRSALDREAA